MIIGTDEIRPPPPNRRCARASRASGTPSRANGYRDGAEASISKPLGSDLRIDQIDADGLAREERPPLGGRARRDPIADDRLDLGRAMGF